MDQAPAAPLCSRFLNCLQGLGRGQFHEGQLRQVGEDRGNVVREEPLPPVRGVDSLASQRGEDLGKCVRSGDAFELMSVHQRSNQRLLESQ
jgi:hypothetical protein